MRTTCVSLIMLFAFFAQAQIEALEWALPYSSPDFNISMGLELDTQDNIYLAGRFEGSLDMDPGPGSLIFNSHYNNPDFFLKKLDTQGNLLWAKNIIPEDSMSSKFFWKIYTDELDHIYIAGEFIGKVDFDPGPDTFYVNSFNGIDEDYFLLKLDASGNFLWVNVLSGEGYKSIISFDADDVGNFYTSGSFRGTIDLDPGTGLLPDTTVLNAKSFVQKYDAGGNLLWSQTFEADSFVRFTTIRTDNFGNSLYAGTYEGQVNFDPATTNYILNSQGENWSMFALKMDASGNILWLADLQASKAGVSRHMVVDSLGNFYNSGLFIGIADFDPGPNQHILTSSQNGDYLSGYIRKLDPQGNLLWVKQMDGDFRNSLEMAYLKLDNEGALYLGGSSRGEVDIDPSPNIELIGFADTTAAYMSKFSSEGDFIWAESFLTISLYGEIIDVAFDRDNNIFSTGNYTYPFDLDPGPGTFTLSANGAVPDFYLAKFKQDGCAALFIQLDSITDVDCDNLGYISLHAEGASGPVNYQWNTTPPSTDSFLVLSRGGFYEIQISDSSGCEKKANYLIQGPQNDTTTDVRVNIFTDAARPGFPFCAWIDASNQSCIPISGELRIVLDSLLILDNANPDTTRGDTLIWYVNNLNYDSSGLMEKIETAVSLQAMIGQEVCVYTALVASMGNMDTLLYKGNLCTDIINGFDPNDMLVSPEGECEEGFILNEQPLTYTIRFQNTGNAEAINIFLLDTLDTDLDPGSMRILGQSHEPMITELIDDRILKFSFDNINLPDNTSNEPQSHGYVIYEILPKANRTVGSEIENRAGIYFDFNEAIVTNTVRNTITDEIPSYDLGISQRGGSLIADQAADPGISFQWVDCTNGNREIPGATSQSFSPEENGSYLVRIREGGCEALSECISLNTVNLEGELLTALQVYPNPVSDKVHIELGETFFDIAISLYHANGQLISRQKIPATDQFSLKLPEQSGIYFLKIEADDKRGQLKLLKR